MLIFNSESFDTRIGYRWGPIKAGQWRCWKMKNALESLCVLLNLGMAVASKRGTSDEAVRA
jgi:hypothetical protein